MKERCYSNETVRVKQRGGRDSKGSACKVGAGDGHKQLMSEGVRVSEEELRTGVEEL